MDENIKEIRKIVKDILKKHKIDIKENKFSVKYVSFADLARDGKYFVEFKNIRAINPLEIRIAVMDEIEGYGKENNFILKHGI